MIDDTLLHELADAPVLAEPRPLAEIASRARVLRRRRRATGGALGVLAVAAAVGVAVPVLQGGDTRVRVTPPAAEVNAGKDCMTGSTDTLSLQAVSALLYLPSAAEAGALQGKPLAREDHPACSAPTSGGYWYSTDSQGRVTKTLTVAGPAETDYYAQPGGPQLIDGETSPVDLAGQPGTMHYSSSMRLGRLFWSEPDGSSWAVTGEGMDDTEIAALAGNLVLQDGRVDLGEAPGGMTPVTPTTAPAGTRPGMWFDVMFGSGEGLPDANFDVDTTDVELQVTVDGVPPSGPGVGDRPVDVNGRLGWLTPGGTGIVTLNWSPAPGVHAMLTDKSGGAHALAVARSVAKVSPTDPRLH